MTNRLDDILPIEAMPQTEKFVCVYKLNSLKRRVVVCWMLDAG